MKFKRTTEILSRLIDNTITNTVHINDFSVGSAIRALYEAVSIEMEQFYILTRENIAQGIEEGVYSAFDFERKPATRSFGVVTVEFHNAKGQDDIIPRGSVFSSNKSEYSQLYETLVDYRVPKGSTTADVEVYCTIKGTVGNIPANTLNVMRSPIANIKKVKNKEDFRTGQDEEPIEELHSRFNSFIESRGRATIPALEYGTREVEEVSGVYIKEKTGQVVVYAHDRNGNLSNRVQRKIIDSLEDYRPAGVEVIVKSVSKQKVDIDAEVTLTKGSSKSDSFKERIEDEIKNYLDRMETSKDLILSDLVGKIRSVDKDIIYDVKITNLSENVKVEGSDVIRSGDISVTFK